MNAPCNDYFVNGASVAKALGPSSLEGLEVLEAAMNTEDSIAVKAGELLPQLEHLASHTLRPKPDDEIGTYWWFNDKENLERVNEFANEHQATIIGRSANASQLQFAHTKHYKQRGALDCASAAVATALTGFTHSKIDPRLPNLVAAGVGGADHVTELHNVNPSHISDMLKLYQNQDVQEKFDLPNITVVRMLGATMTDIARVQAKAKEHGMDVAPIVTHGKSGKRTMWHHAVLTHTYPYGVAYRDPRQGKPANNYSFTSDIDLARLWARSFLELHLVIGEPVAKEPA